MECAYDMEPAALVSIGPNIHARGESSRECNSPKKLLIEVELQTGMNQPEILLYLFAGRRKPRMRGFGRKSRQPRGECACRAAAPSPIIRGSRKLTVSEIASPRAAIVCMKPHIGRAACAPHADHRKYACKRRLHGSLAAS